MPRFVLCTLGDLLLDVIVRLEQALEPGTDAAAHTRSSPSRGRLWRIRRATRSTERSPVRSGGCVRLTLPRRR